MEIWKPVLGLEGRYEASNLGRIKGIRLYGRYTHPRILTPRINKDGYLKLDIKKDEDTRLFVSVHRLVALAFIGKPPTELHTVNHKDGNKTNNNVENLEWATRREQSVHFYNVLNGKDKRPRGKGNHFRAKFSDDEIRKIREMRSNGHTFESIRNVFNNQCSNVTIQNICSGKIYFHVE